MTTRHILTIPDGEPYLIGQHFTVGNRSPQDFKKWQRSVGIDPDAVPDFMDRWGTTEAEWDIRVGEQDNT
jgi:hypothetical protein